jgi:hypothetical protein
LSVVAVREARVESSSLARRALASLEFRRDYLVACRAAFSLAKAQSVADRAAFSLDGAFFNSAVKAINPETSRSQEKNHRLEAVKEERVPSRSASVSFKPSKKSVIRRVESLASMVEQIAKLVPPTRGGAEAPAVGEDARGTASD